LLGARVGAAAQANQAKHYTSEWACPSDQETTLLFPFCPPFLFYFRELCMT